jgi:hypothetical protein
MLTIRSTLVLVGLCLLGGGCKATMSPASSSTPYGDDGASAGAADYGGIETEEADDAPALSSRSERKSGRPGRDSKRMSKEMMASPAPAEAASPTVTKAEPAVEDDTQDLDTRHIIYVANMTVSVFNLEEAVAKAEALPEALGGYVHSMDAGTLVLRVPAKKLRKALGDIAELGVVEHRSLSAQDVSAEFVDIESRIRALETTQKQLLELMGKARTVDEALHVRQALDGVTSELEVLKGRMRQLDNLIAYSTITVTLMERGPHTPVPSSNDPFPWVDNLGVESTEWK